MASIEPQKVSKIIDDEVSLRVCSSEAEPIKCLRWQPAGSPTFSDRKGVTFEDSKFLEKAKGVVQLAQQKNADLLLVPEYSFPHALLDDIVSDKSKWPKPGALWCFATQGEQISDFRQRLSRWASAGAKVCNAEIRQEKSFVCPLVYMFVSDSGVTLHIVVQYKLQWSSDKWFEHEGPNLSLGQTIFVFDLTKESLQAVNYFFSLICSDILYRNYSSIIEQIEQQGPNNRHYLIFHPQLNPKPRHESFVQPRNSLFNCFPGKVQLLTLNWAKGTSLGDKFRVDDPWSCFYRSQRFAFSEHRLLEQIDKNHGCGVFFSRSSHRDIWYSLEEEHVSNLVIPRGHVCSAYNPVSCITPFVAKKFYYWCGSAWEKQDSSTIEKMIQEDMEQHLEHTDEAYRFPLDTDVIARDLLFGMCRGSPKKEFESDSQEEVVRTQWSVGKESQMKRRDLIDAYNGVVKQLKLGNLPPTLKHLEEGFKPFIYKANEPTLEHMPHNLYPKSCVDCFNCKDDKHKCDYRGIVAFTQAGKAELFGEFTAIKNKVDVGIQDKIVFYYQDRGNGGIKFFDGHLSTNFVKGERIRNLTSIRNV